MKHKNIYPSIVLAALGYFVDIYDLILFSIVRIKSLKGIGVPDSELLSQGVLLLNMQMGGMLLGGILWGVLGDKKGRLSVLIGSICLYSVANIANGFVHDINTYAALRFIAGIGLAGELGAGITLVSEIMPKEIRAYGTMIVSAVGILGAVVAALIGDFFDWRIAYIVGGAMGIGLLLLRIKVSESGLFHDIQMKNVKKGNLLIIVKSANNFMKYLRCILIGVPLWFVIGILVTFSPEFGQALNMPEIPQASKGIMFAYIGLSLGGLASGTLSQIWASRKKAVMVFMGLNALLMAIYLFVPTKSLAVFYLYCFGLGIASGYWALFVTIAAEQFGTNIRSTVATTVPNFVRGAVVPMTLSFQALKDSVGIINAGWIVGLVCVLLAMVSILYLEETHGRDLNYIDEC